MQDSIQFDINSRSKAQFNVDSQNRLRQISAQSHLLSLIQKLHQSKKCIQFTTSLYERLGQNFKIFQNLYSAQLADQDPCEQTRIKMRDELNKNSNDYVRLFQSLVQFRMPVNSNEISFLHQQSRIINGIFWKPYNRASLNQNLSRNSKQFVRCCNNFLQFQNAQQLIKQFQINGQDISAEQAKKFLQQIRQLNQQNIDFKEQLIQAHIKQTFQDKLGVLQKLQDAQNSNFPRVLFLKNKLSQKSIRQFTINLNFQINNNTKLIDSTKNWQYNKKPNYLLIENLISVFSKGQPDNSSDQSSVYYKLCKNLELKTVERLLYQVLACIVQSHKVNIVYQNILLNDIKYSTIDNCFKIDSGKMLINYQIKNKQNKGLNLNSNVHQYKKYNSQYQTIMDFIETMIEQKNMNTKKIFNKKNLDYVNFVKIMLNLIFQIQVDQQSFQNNIQKPNSVDLLIEQKIQEFLQQRQRPQIKFNDSLMLKYSIRRLTFQGKNNLMKIFSERQKQQFDKKLTHLLDNILQNQSQNHIVQQIIYFLKTYLKKLYQQKSQLSFTSQSQIQAKEENQNNKPPKTDFVNQNNFNIQFKNYQNQLSKLRNQSDTNILNFKIQNDKPFKDSYYQVSKGQLQKSYKRYLDNFDIKLKKKIFLSLTSKGINPSVVKNKINTNQQYVQFLKRDNMINNILFDLSCGQMKQQIPLIDRIIFLLLLRKNPTSSSEKLGILVNNKIKQFKNVIDRGEGLEDQLQKNRTQFWFDDTLDLDSNFAIFKFSVYYIFNRTLPNNLKSILKNIFDQPNLMLYWDEQEQQQFKQQVDQQFIKGTDKSLYQKKLDEQLKIKINKSKKQSNDIINKTKKQFKMHKKNKKLKYFTYSQKQQIIKKYNNLSQLQGFFRLDDSLITLHIAYKQNYTFNFNYILNIDCPYIEAIIIPLKSIKTQGLKKICQKWKDLKILYVWDCDIQTLFDSGLQLLKDIKSLSLSNNPLNKDSVPYLLQHRWQFLVELRISFKDGSQSLDLLIPQIKTVFPRLISLFIRQLTNVNVNTIKNLLSLRYKGLFVYFRMQKKIIQSLLQQFQYRNLDFEGQNDIAYFEQSQKQIIKNQLQIIQNQEEILSFDKQKLNDQTKNKQ